MHEGDPEKLYRGVERLISGLAWSWHRSYPPLEVDDLEQLGAMSFLRAVTSFDPTRGTKFSTHLANLVKNDFRDEVAKLSTRQKHIPSHLPEHEWHAGGERTDVEVEFQDYYKVLHSRLSPLAQKMLEVQWVGHPSYVKNKELRKALGVPEHRIVALRKEIGEQIERLERENEVTPSHEMVSGISTGATRPPRGSHQLSKGGVPMTEESKEPGEADPQAKPACFGKMYVEADEDGAEDCAKCTDSVDCKSAMPSMKPTRPRAKPHSRPEAPADKAMQCRANTLGAFVLMRLKEPTDPKILKQEVVECFGGTGTRVDDMVKACREAKVLETLDDGKVRYIG